MALGSRICRSWVHVCKYGFTRYRRQAFEHALWHYSSSHHNLVRTCCGSKSIPIETVSLLCSSRFHFPRTRTNPNTDPSVPSRDHRIYSVVALLVGALASRCILGTLSGEVAVGIAAGIKILIAISFWWVPNKGGKVQKPGGL